MHGFIIWPFIPVDNRKRGRASEIHEQFRAADACDLGTGSAAPRAAVDIVRALGAAGVLVIHRDVQPCSTYGIINRRRICPVARVNGKE